MKACVDLAGELAQRCKKVIAFEIDYPLYHQLQRTFAANEKVEGHQGDLLAAPLPQTAYKVFSNIPSHIPQFDGQVL